MNQSKTIHMTSRFFFIFSIFALILTGCNSKSEKADTLRLECRFSEAFDLYKQAADEGDAYAKWRLAKAYGNGLGVEMDEAKAWSLLQEAHIEGCPQATCDVSMAYLYGHYGVEENVKKGKMMLEKLCQDTDDSYSLTCYAVELYYGGYFPKDKEKAMRILESIKDKDEPRYLQTMGFMYRDGTEKFEPDKQKGLEYWTKSYEKGNGYAAYLIANDKAINTKQTEANINEIVEWYNKGIRRNSTSCMKALASICTSEDTIYKKWHNINQGIELLERAGELGDGEAYSTLGNMYYHGDGVIINYDKAFKYFKKAYELKNLWGTNNLGAMYFDGKGCEKDIPKAIALYKEASDGGYGHASKNLYNYYYNPNYGFPHEVNKELAKKYLLLSASQGSEYGSLILAQHYYRGTDLFDKDLYTAFSYYKQAADMGNIEACEAVAYMYDNGVGCNKNPNEAKRYLDMTKPKDSPNKEE